METGKGYKRIPSSPHAFPHGDLRAVPSNAQDEGEEEPDPAGSTPGSPPPMLNPAPTECTSPVTPEAQSERRYAAAFPTSSCVTFRRSKAPRALFSISLRKSPTPEAASVRIGPAETALTRIPSGPRSWAR